MAGSRAKFANHIGTHWFVWIFCLLTLVLKGKRWKSIRIGGLRCGSRISSSTSHVSWSRGSAKRTWVDLFFFWRISGKLPANLSANSSGKFFPGISSLVSPGLQPPPPQKKGSLPRFTPKIVGIPRFCDCFLTNKWGKAFFLTNQGGNPY